MADILRELHDRAAKSATKAKPDITEDEYQSFIDRFEELSRRPAGSSSVLGNLISTGVGFVSWALGVPPPSPLKSPNFVRMLGPRRSNPVAGRVPRQQGGNKKRG